MKEKFGILFLLLTMLAGCATHTFKKPPVNAPSDDAGIKLAEAASSVSHSMREIASIEKTVTPPHVDNTLTIPNAHQLQTRATIDWAGPIEELTFRIARAANYKFRVLGNAPPIPVLISLTRKDLSLAEILRDIDYQAGKKADIHVYPNSHVVELRYAKTHC